MKKELLLGNDRLTEKEKEKLVLTKNTKYSGDLLEAVLDGQSSLTGGLVNDIWDDRERDGVSIINPRVIQLRNVIRRYFFELFKWEGLEYDFIYEMERILFRYGKVAIIKVGLSHYPVNFTYKDTDLDFYGNPKRIKVISRNQFNNQVFKKGNFVIGYNNNERYGVLTWMIEDLRQYARARIGVDNASIASMPRFLIKAAKKDRSFVDANNMLQKGDLVVNMPDNLSLLGNNTDVIQAQSVTDERILLVKTTLDYILENIGLTTAGIEKKERVTELEIANNDKYNGLLITNMLNERIRLTEAMKEIGLNGVTVSNVVEEEELKEKEEQKKMLNGEENKNKVEND